MSGTPRTTRRRRTAVAAVLLAVAAVLAPAAAAHATTTVICLGQESYAYSPGMTNTTQSLSLTSSTTFGSCSGVSTSAPVPTAGAYGPRVSTPTVSCSSLLTSGSGTRTITWSDGRQSVFTYTRTGNAVGGNLVILFTGSFTSGLYSGATVTQQVVAPGLTQTLAACATPAGLASLSGAATLTITGL